ncbi:MAG: MFS transporter [Chloroflexi bacterium]|jgi:MFS family permease|nr:MFS transporter [Chloroflexota bacterium]MBT4072250.1 MFS transporter [Chloroflexota bacterium]MBT4515997.1 MFS transporter [Chloroflexota bacterium]MBT6680926.1 MFS transporter [Chloroflexota bacterium]
MSITSLPAEGQHAPKRTGLYRGWPIAVIASLASGLTIGMSGYAYGVFVDPLEEEFGWSRTELNFSLTISVISLLIGPFVGRWIDRFGSRPVMVVSLAFVAVGFVMYSSMTELWHFYVASFLLFLGMPGATMLPSGRLISIWFAGTRGRMMGIVTAGNNGGGLSMVALSTFVVSAAGWRAGYITFAVMIVFIGILVALYVRDRQNDVIASRGKRLTPPMPAAGAMSNSDGFTLKEVLRMKSFYFLAIGHAIPAFSYGSVLTQLIPHFEAEGFSSGEAAFGLMLLAVFGIVSKILFGRLSESITARWAMVISLGIQAVGMVLLVLAGGSIAVWPVIVFYAMGFGAMGALIPLTVTEAFGLRAYGTILGVTSMVGAGPLMIGPVMAGRLFDLYGTYDAAFIIIAVMFVLGAVSMSLARRPEMPGRSA